jgi:hypothetical protein
LHILPGKEDKIHAIAKDTRTAGDQYDYAGDYKKTGNTALLRAFA